APGTLESRWLTEDIPYGIAAWSKLGTQYGVQTPVIDAFVGIGSIVMGIDAWSEGRGPKQLGLEGMTKKELKEYLNTGK
ncbi:MAG: NAD/NADP octopine/nopaline dehydrogenase family protein, partial [Chloroflexota bacterium]|nr:NAD/NADP octopine/nopaline dehydrogenase family protein [Chloroflexota bacterium]